MSDIVVTAVLPPSPTKKHRRKRTKLPTNLSEAEKELWRKQNNKKAAQDLRNRRKHYEDELKSRHDALEAENRDLELRTSHLEQEQAGLRQKLDLFKQCLSAVESEQPDSGKSSNSLNGSMEPACAPAFAMDTTDDNDKITSQASVAFPESAALNPQQSELQRMAPVLILLLGSILSQPLPSATPTPTSNTATTASSSKTASSPSTSKTTTSTPSTHSSKESSRLRRSRRLAKRTSEVVHPPSPSSTPTQVSSRISPASANSAQAACLSAPSLNPPALSSSPTLSSKALLDSSPSMDQASRLLALTLQQHLRTIAEKAALNTIKTEAEDISSDPIQSLLPWLSATA